MNSTIRAFMKNGKYATYYIWTTDSGDDPKKKKRDRELLSRKEGYEVADLIEDIFDELDWEATAENVSTLEQDIHKAFGDIEKRAELFSLIVMVHEND